MYEIIHTRQTNRSYIKRWFSSREMDLFVWSRGGIPIRFQLAYDKLSNEKAINWDQHDLAIIAHEFLAACERIDIGLSGFIYARLMEQPLEHVKNNARYTDHPPL